MGLVKIYKKHLSEMGLFDRYDGSSLISYNLKEFEKKILPRIIHSEKISLANFMLNGCGKPPKNYLEILIYINLNPSKTAKELSKALKKNKSYSELKILKDFGFISSKGYPFKYEISPKGLSSLGD